MKTLKIIIFIFMLIALAWQFYETKQMPRDLDTQLKKPVVSLSTFSLYEIAKNISQDTVELVMVLPFGSDIHSFEPTPKLVAKISTSDLLIYNGAGLEPWIKGIEAKNKTINMSEYVKLLNIEDADGHEEEHDHEHSATCSHNGIDPHYWLDTENMIIATNIIAEELIHLLPANKALYLQNKEVYIQVLQSLDILYKEKLSTCQLHTIVVNHNAFSYLAQKYGFEVESLTGFSSEAQPSAKNMIKLIEHVKEHNVKTVFFESFVSDKAMKNIAKEANVKIDVLQPLGNITADEAKQNLSYEAMMKINLQKISEALQCQ